MLLIFFFSLFILWNWTVDVSVVLNSVCPFVNGFINKVNVLNIGTSRPPYHEDSYSTAPTVSCHYGAGGAEMSGMCLRLLSDPLFSTRRFMFHYSKSGHSCSAEPPPVRSGGLFLLYWCSFSSSQRHAVHVFLQTSVLPRGPDPARVLQLAALLSDAPQVTGVGRCRAGVGPVSGRALPAEAACLSRERAQLKRKLPSDFKNFIIFFVCWWSERLESPVFDQKQRFLDRTGLRAAKVPWLISVFLKADS